MIGGAILGLTVAGAAGWLLGSWLAFAICALPLVAVGMVFGTTGMLADYQHRIIEEPGFVDIRAGKLMRAGKWREASLVLLQAAHLVEQAAQEARPDRDALALLAARWNAQARTCVRHYVNQQYGPFARWRAGQRDGAD